MANKVLMRGFSKLPYDTRQYELSTNMFVACAEALGTIQDIDYVDIPNGIIVAIHYTTA